MPREQTSTPAGTGAGPLPSGLGDVLLLLWRERGFMILVFIVSFLLMGGAAMLLLDKTYTAQSTLLVRYDEAYAYDPVLGGQNSVTGGLATEAMIQNEISVLRSEEVKRLTIIELGLRAIYPDLANRYIEAPEGEARERIMAAAVRLMEQNLSVSSVPASANIVVGFTHERADVSARVTNTLIDKYLERRQAVLLDSDPEGFQLQRDESEAQLAGLNAELQRFLEANGIGDFEAERASLTTRQAQVDADLLAATADRAQKGAELGTLRSQIASVPAEISLYVENNSTATLAQLQVERADLAARFTDESIQMQEIDERIRRQQELIASGATEGAGLVRTGANPTYQTLETAEAQAEADAAALGQRVAELTRQKEDLRNRQLVIAGLQPQYDRLRRDIDALQATVNAIASRQRTDLAQRSLATGALDNVSTVQPAVVPAQGESLKKPAVAGAFVVSGFISLLAGLARGLLRGGPGFGWLEWTPRERAPRPARPPRATRQARNVPRPDQTPGDGEPDPYAPPPRLPVLAVIGRHAPTPAYG